jgi:hypothetical protein
VADINARALTYADAVGSDAFQELFV